MEHVFIHLLNMSITASWITIAVIILRLILKKAPKWIMGVLWGFVALRLICPFSFECAFSLIPVTETVPQEILTTNTPTINSGLDLINEAINPVISGLLSPVAAESMNPMQVVVFVASVIWIVGIAVMLAYTLISYLRIYRKVQEAVSTDNGYLVCDRIPTPFILGVFRPRIYLPSAMNETDCSYVLCHERAHLKRKDYLWKPLGFLLLTVYWFNPVMWIAYILLCRDIELACDEKVIRQMGTEIKKTYSNALINCSAPRHMIAACPLAFGEVAVKERVKNVLSYKKPTFWIIIVAVIVCIIVAVCLLTNPMGTKIKDTPKPTIKEIIDRVETENISTVQSSELFYSDETNYYMFSSVRSQYVIVTYTDGTTRTVKEALTDGEISISDLDRYEIDYFKNAFEPSFDSVFADIDNDGVEEHCILSHGPTSGLFTFNFIARAGGVVEYFNTFNTQWYDLSFAEHDGKVYVQGITDDSKTHLYSILCEEGSITLSENGKQLDRFNEPVLSN